jgi:hypothetical protein
LRKKEEEALSASSSFLVVRMCGAKRHTSLPIQVLFFAGLPLFLMMWLAIDIILRLWINALIVFLI